MATLKLSDSCMTFRKTRLAVWFLVGSVASKDQGQTDIQNTFGRSNPAVTLEFSIFLLFPSMKTMNRQFDLIK